MQPVVLETARLRLDQPVAGDRDRVLEYCRDPLFEAFMTLPWPYETRHADYFLGELVPRGWADASELTWAIRSAPGRELMGVIGWRRGRGDLGYWIGAPHRGAGYMTEALAAVTAWLFDEAAVESVAWECVAGNRASAAVARKSGFRFTGERPTQLTFRDGTHPLAWHGELAAADDRRPRDGWPL